MPPGPFIPDLTQAVVHWDTPQGPATNVLWFDQGSLSFQAACAEFIASLEAAWADTTTGQSIRLSIAAPGRPTFVDFTDYSTQFGAQLSLAPSTAAGQGGIPLPPDLAIVISWRTGVGGARHRGRTYVPGLARECLNNTNGQIATTHREAIQNFGQKLRDNLLTSATPLVVYSRVGSGAMTQVLTASVDPHFDVQRRRGD